MTQSRDSASAQVDLAAARLAKALASRTQIDVARRSLEAAQKSEQKAAKGIDLSEIGNDQIHEIELLVKVKEQSVEQARRALEAAESDLAYTRVRAPFPGIVVKRYRHLGDHSPAGSPLLSMYNPELLYMEANLEEDRLPGVEPGNPVHIKLDAFPEPFRGRVVWVNKSTGGTVRAHAEECGLRRVYARRSARARPHPDRTRRPLAATPRRAIRDRGNRSWSWRRRLGGGCVPGDEGARDAIQRHGEDWGNRPSTATHRPPGRDHDNACRFCPKLDRRPGADHARAPPLAGRPGHALCSLRALPDAGPDGHHRRRNPPGRRGRQLRHDLGERGVPGRMHLRSLHGHGVVSSVRQARYTRHWFVDILRRKCALWRCDRALSASPLAEWSRGLAS